MYGQPWKLEGYPSPSHCHARAAGLRGCALGQYRDKPVEASTEALSRFVDKDRPIFARAFYRRRKLLALDRGWGKGVGVLIRQDNEDLRQQSKALSCAWL